MTPDVPLVTWSGRKSQTSDEQFRLESATPEELDRRAHLRGFESFEELLAYLSRELCE